MPLSRVILYDHDRWRQRTTSRPAQAAAVESRTVLTTTDRSCSRLAAMPAIACHLRGALVHGGGVAADITDLGRDLLGRGSRFGDRPRDLSRRCVLLFHRG